MLSNRQELAERHPVPGATGLTSTVAERRSVRCRRGRGATPASNQEALEALRRSSDDAERRLLRDHLVRRNLPLVYAVTARMAGTLSVPQEDLRQVGSLGLLRAIEAFDPERGRTLSSFAVPYIRGAIQHELRDRASLMRIPRPLWELRRRASVLQDRRRRLGQPQLAPAQLAEALDCSTAQVVEALQVGAVVEMRSLDAPSSVGVDEDATGRTLLELLADPASLACSDPEPTAAPADDPLAALLNGESPASGASQAIPDELAHERPQDTGPGRPPGADSSCPTREEPSAREPGGGAPAQRLGWLQQRLQALTALERQLLMGHVCLGRSWAELGREHGLHARKVQRRTDLLLRQLAAEASHWEAGGPQPQSTA